MLQGALAAGAPLGRVAWGGQHERLPAALRIGSVVSIAIYGVFAWIILERAGHVTLASAPGAIRIAAWCVVGYCGLGVLMNAISRSLPERMVMTPVALSLFVSSLSVALN